MIKKLYILILIGTLLSACDKKNYPPSIVENEASFFSTMRINGNPIEIKAGFNNYYMYSSIEQDTSRIYRFVGELTKKDCKNCPLGLKIQINDYKVSEINGPVNIDSSLALKRYPYYQETNGPAYQVSFKGFYNKAADVSEYVWNFGDGATATGVNPLHTYAMDGNYNVCLTVKGKNGCVSNICNNISANSDNLNASITSTAIGTDSVIFDANIMNGFPGFTYEWNFGDGKTDIGKSPRHKYTFPGSYAVTLRVTDGGGNKATASYNAVTNSDLSSCASNMQLVQINRLTALSQIFSKTVISWTDENGVTYNSSKAAQPSTSYFEIISVENSEPNEKGQATKKLKVKFDCRLFNGNSSIRIENAEATICVAVK